MLSALPNPILSVQVEGVRELDGREALSGLWTLFSKCKESIDGGRRLENISWRLWYRDMLVTGSARSDGAILKSRSEDEFLDEKAYRPPTPMETVISSQSDRDISQHPAALPPVSPGTLHSITPPAASQAVPRSHQLSTDNVRKPRTLLAVGQIICEMLPTPFEKVHSPATSPRFISLSMSPSSGGATRIPRSERLSTLPASLGRSDLAGSHLHISGAAFLPLVPLLPLPEPNSTHGTRIVAPSQLPTPGTEEDESAPFVKPVVPYTPESVDGTISGPSIPLRYQDSSIGPQMSSSAASPNSEPECLTITGPPSPSLSDSYVRAHPNETTTVDDLQEAGVPGIIAPVQSPKLSQPHSDTGVETSKPHSLPVPALDEGTPVPIVATPPRLVVVNPTPGPTPHPTPPATPLSFLTPADNARLRPHGQFLAPPSARMASQQLAPVPAPVFNLGGNSPVGDTRGPTGANLDRSDRSTVPLKDAGRTIHQVVTESRATPSPRIQSTPPTQDQTSVEEARRPRAEVTNVDNAQDHVPPSHNPNRLSTSSTASTSSTGGTTTSNASSSSRLSVGATSVNTDVSSEQRSSGSASSDGLKTLISKGPAAKTLTQDSPMKSPTSPTQASHQASTSVTSVKSAKSVILAATKSSARPGLARRASSGGAGGRSRKAGNASTASRATSNSSDSRSRSRDAVSRKDTAAAAGALAAAMGMTTVTAGGPSGGARKRVGAKMGGRGRIALARTISRGAHTGGAALKRTLSHEEVEEVTDEDDEEEMRVAAAAREREQREKEEREREAAAREATAFEENEQKVIAKASRAKFKFGSNSDNGSNAGTEISSRAPGSEMYGGYDVKGKGRELDLAAQERHTQELKERELAVQRAREGAAVLEREKLAKQEQARKEAEAVARARAHESVADPLLPQANKRTILLTSESDYTDTDDESWTSEDVEEGGTAQAVAPRHPPPTTRQPQHHEPRQPQHHAPPHPPHPQQHPPAPPAVQRTHSNTSGAGRTSRREWQHIQQRREAQLRIQKVAAQLQREEEEKQRQRDMFAKKPTTSFQNLTELQRNRSTGLLTQLMNPDPTIFPANHPYRRGHSSGEIQRMGMTPMTGMTAMTAAAQPQPRRTQTEPTQQQQQQQQQEQPAPNGHAPAAAQSGAVAPVEQKATQPSDRQQQSKDADRARAPPRRAATLDSQHTQSAATTTAPSDTSTAAPPSPVRSERRAPSLTNVAVNLALRGMRTLGLATGKSTTAGPMASQVIAGSVTTKHAAKASAAAPPTSPEVRSPSGSNGYRPKGPLPGQEMDSDSDDEGEDALQFSKSVAQDRLKQFAARRGIVAAGPTLPPQPEDDEVPGWAREDPKGKAPALPQQSAAPLPAPGPIPVMHPYNLPVNAVPSTPRTTRRQMLRNEMSESLRRQLLWERQQAGVPIRRTTSTGHVGPQRTSTLNGIKPLTTTPSMVQLHAKGTTGNRQPSHLRQEVEAGGSDTIRGSGERERRGSARPAEGDQEARRQALARNRSWTNDYHTSGW